MSANRFDVEVLSDGKIKVTSPGGFAKEVHADADEFLDMMKDLAGGEVATKKIQPNLANPHGQSQGSGQQHKH
jgi:hypothetical protein